MKLKKMLVLLGFMLLLSCFILISKDSKLPVFLVTEEPETLTKGHFGSVFIVELTFEHKDLMTFIQHPINKNTLFLMDIDFIERADHVIDMLQQHQRQFGLLVSAPEQFSAELATYQKILKQQPLWLMLKSGQYDTSLRNKAFAAQVNVISPSFVLEQPYPKQIEKGSFVSLRLSEDDELQVEPLVQWMKTQSFVSIEESLFGFTTRNKKSP